MKFPDNFIKEIIEEALKQKQGEGPKHLLETISQMQDPFAENQTEDEFERWHIAYAKDLSFVVGIKRFSDDVVNDIDRQRCVDLICWFFNVLKNIEDEKPSAAILRVLIEVTSVFHDGQSIWSKIPKNYLSRNLLSCMAALIGSATFLFTSRSDTPPIWESEIIENFSLADKDEDWPVVAELWQRVSNALPSDIFAKEAVECMLCTEGGILLLIDTLDNFETIYPIMTLAEYLPISASIRIAKESKNSRIRFSLIQNLVVRLNWRSVLDEQFSDDLVSLLKIVQKDKGEWVKWMEAFNRYPIRSHCIQGALGKSLVGASRTVCESFLDVIKLSNRHSGSRDALSLSFKTFRENASFNERQRFWNIVFHKWNSWNFDLSEKGNSLTSLAVSELDYGVVGYAIESINDDGLRIILEDLSLEMFEFRLRWYRDQIAFDTEWYKILSKWNIFTFAQKVKSGEIEWELPMQQYLPFDPEKDRYFALELGTKPLC